jgi:hypothetical protein
MRRRSLDPLGAGHKTQLKEVRIRDELTFVVLSCDGVATGRGGGCRE